MLIAREAIRFSGRPFKALGQKRGQTHRSHKRRGGDRREGRTFPAKKMLLSNKGNYVFLYDFTFKSVKVSVPSTLLVPQPQLPIKIVEFVVISSSTSTPSQLPSLYVFARVIRRHFRH
jgi:hypothetical protein